ncbi:MAG: EAL domain-containing protein [Woeseia sp.]
MSDKNSISIAVLSRSQEDVERVNTTLRSAGYAAHCSWIADPQQFDDALGQEALELIILFAENFADNVRQVVKHKHTYYPELPVIAVQSIVDEAAIQDAMRFGARDLVSSNLQSRWLSVFERELRAMRLERALNVTVNAANEYKRQLHNYMQRSDNPIAYAQDGIVTSANSAWIELFEAASSDEIVGLPLMDRFARESHAAIKGALVATVKGKWQSDEKLNARGHANRNDSQPLELCFELVEFEDGPHVQVEILPPAVVVEEPTKLVHDALQRDPTTLFYHRAQFLDRLQKRLANKPSSGIHVLACIRPDNFATIQKDTGYIESEELLAQFAEQLRLRLHPRDFAGRFEGTAIMVLLERGNENDAAVWGKQLVDHMHDAVFTIGDQAINLTCTVGVCAATGVFSTLEELVAATMESLHLGREHGGNMVHVNESDDSDSRLRRFDEIWVKHIRAALMEDRFRLAQLPIAGLRSEANGMYDMLVRMLDEQGQSVLPSEFLPAAERNNLMKTIDRWILTSAMDFCIDESAELVFVRLSRQSLQDSSLVNWVQQELNKRQMPARRLCVQAAERDAAVHIKNTRVLAEGFRKMGVPFAISHYGVDKTRVQILDILKPNYIKIDGELMHSLIADTEMQGNVRALTEACEKRGILTIAERVENANEMAVLFQLGVNYMQGHYVHEPEVVLAEAPRVAASSLDAIVNS